jgi:hypothetical protein
MRREIPAAIVILTFWGVVAAGGEGPARQNVGAPPAKVDKKDSVYFTRDVMPVITRLGCSTVQCHGAAAGKGDLRLSLFGADPALDYDALTRAAGGRRIDRLEPLESLLLLKTTGAIPHEGAQPLRPEQPEYAVLVAWLKQNAPWGDADEPKLVSIKVSPKEQTLQKGATQQLATAAIYSDGSQRDVTRQAIYTSIDPKAASVDAAGQVRAEGCGDSVVVASYMRVSDAARVLIPRPLPQPFPQFQPNNRIDELVFADLKQLGIPPSEVCGDEALLRRVSLDLIGTLPTPDEVRAFLQDQEPAKRSKLIDRLMEREEFADYWALKWGDLLRIKSEFPVRLWPKGAQTYYRWVHQSIVENKPYDQFARELLTASGSNFRCGPVNFFRANPTKDPQTIAESTALIFLGVRLGCARCHGHPTENWNLDDDLGLAAFFSKVAFKATQEWKEEVVYVNRKAVLRHPWTKEILKPKYLGGDVVPVEDQKDARGKFVEWLVSPENPYFVKNIVNRVWSWFLGRGIIHEPDDLRPTNPPSHAALLEFLEQDFVAHKYDLRHLFRLVLSSKTYQLSSEPNEWNQDDLRHFSHFHLRRLTAEQLLDAIGQVTETSEPFNSPIPEPFTRLPAGYRAAQLYDGDINAPFLELFGRPPRDTPYECERNLGTSLRQALHLINSEHLQNKVNSSPRLQRWLKEKRSDEQIVDDLYLLALSRPPTPDEKQKLLAFLGEDPKQHTQAVQDAVWAVVNTKEFLFNH